MSLRRALVGAPSRSGGRLRRLLAVFGVIGLAVTTAVAVPSAAYANPNSDVVVSDVTLTNEDGGQATVGDTLTVSGSWDATAAEPKSGDTFTIGLPSELGFAQAVPFNLDGPDPSGNVVTWATCLTDPATGVATCTFTDEVVENSEFVKGTFEFDVLAESATTEEEVVFDLNGTEVPVDLPGEGGIDDGVVLPVDWLKAGSLNADKWSMTWTIELPGSRLVGHDVVNILEELSGNHVLCDPSNLRIQTVRGSTVVDVTSIGSTSTDVSDPYDFQITLNAPTGGFDPNVTYRITYDTCTPDGQIDPEGTVYGNEATVDIWGASSGVIGVTQDWSFSGQISKQGSVLGGADRNGKIQWTVTVAGDHLEGKNTFTLTESLTGEHEVCAGTISGIRIFERYGPSTSLQKEITGDLSASVVSSSATGFEVQFSIADGSAFVFQPSDHLYLIQYVTCATTDGLPEAGTVFGNTAGVDGATDGSDATVPGRTDHKSGGINASTVTIDGVAYLPQTTLNWNITVPGENVADVDSALTVTDTLSSAHEVCVGSGGDIASRLDLRVEARDQVQGGGLATVDLTAGVSATLDGDEITITIPQPTLPLPGGGAETGFSREYQYVITYTTCTTSGGMDAPGTVYGNDAEVAGKTYTQSVTQSNRGSGTGQGMPRGTVAIQKSLADTPGAAFVPSDATFTVHVKEIDPAGAVQVEYDLAVPLDGDPVSGFNSRGNGWTIELSEPTFPTIPGVVFGAPVFAEGDGVTLSDGGTIATAALVPATNIPIALTNTALLGSLDVLKTVDGGAAALVNPDLAYRVTASIDVSGLGAGFPAQSDRVFELIAGETEPHVLDDLPIGATVTFSELVPADDDILTWGTPTIDPNGIEITAGHASDPATITVTNHVERTVGTFALVKEVSGAQADNPAVPETVAVTATWVQEGTPGEKTLTLPTDGTPVPFGEHLLIGTEVTLTEAHLVDGSSIAWGAPVWSGTGVTPDGTSAIVTIGRDAAAQVTLENHAATSTAGISLLKGIAGEAAGEVDPATEFPVTATWTDAAGIEQSKDLFINAVTPTSLGEDLPAGTVVTLTEGERPAFDTVVWGSITISGDDVEDAGDGSATVVVSDQQGDVTLVTVVNDATWAPGTFSVTKSVEDILLEHSDVPETVTVIATWIDDGGVQQSHEFTLPTDGTVVPLGFDLPHGTEVTLTEETPDAGASFTWADPHWDGTAVEARPDGSAIVTIGAATVAEVALTNTAVALTGSLTLTKELMGDGAIEVSSNTVFPFTLTWTDLLGNPQQLDIEVSADEPVVIDGLPLGTEVRLVEGDAELPVNVYWDDVTWTTDADNISVTADDRAAVITIVGEQGTEASLTATNEFLLLPDLPLTGSTFGLAPIFLTVALLVAGAWLVYRGRRNPAQIG